MDSNVTFLLQIGVFSSYDDRHVGIFLFSFCLCIYSVIELLYGSSQLDNKQRELRTADKKLAELTDQLRFTEQRVAHAAEHLIKITELANRSRPAPISPEKKEQLEDKLNVLHNTVREKEMSNNASYILLLVCENLVGKQKSNVVALFFPV